MKYRHFFAIFLLCFSQFSAFAKPTIAIRPSSVQMDEPFHLIITTEALKSAPPPNLAPLQKDFTILGTQRSLSYSIINGQTTSLSQWIILLNAKKTGNLTIPAITLGHEQTDPMVVHVAEAPASSKADTDGVTPSGGSRDVLIRTSISEKKPYINQQTVYTIKLYNSKQLLDVEYKPPTVVDGILVPLGDGRHYQAQLDNQNYAVDEQQYALFAQKSGDLKIEPPSVKAMVYDAMPRRIHLTPKTTHLEVRPIPANADAKAWFPAKKVILSETYEPTTTTLKEGDSVTRTITIQAIDAPGQLIPETEFKSNDAFGVYPETPESKSTIQSNQLIGVRTIKVTYVFNKGKEVTLPRLEIPWFNVNTNQAAVASLPARHYQIQSTAPLKTATPMAKKMPQNHLAHATPSSGIQPTSPNQGTLLATAIGFFSAWGIILLFWLFKHFGLRSKGVSKKSVLKQLHHACKTNQALKARDALLQFAHLQWPQATLYHLHDIARWCNDAHLKQQLIILSEVLYNAKREHVWHGLPLYHAFLAYLKQQPQTQKNASQTSSDLPPLNPTV